MNSVRRHFGMHFSYVIRQCIPFQLSQVLAIENNQFCRQSPTVRAKNTFDLMSSIQTKINQKGFRFRSHGSISAQLLLYK